MSSPTPYERLMAEELPTGTFGHALPPKPPPRPPGIPWTPEEQAQHVADMLRGIAGWTYSEPDPEEEPHLRLVEDETGQDDQREKDSA